MATLTVLGFPTAEGADAALAQIKELQKQQLIKLHDAAVVTWKVGRKSPRTRQLLNVVGVSAMSGMFWGLLFGFIFLVPLLGMALGGATGALTGAFRDYGISDDFIERVRSAVMPGTSALFLMTSDAVIDRVAEAMRHTQFEIIATNLSSEQEEKLREVFGHEETASV
jgi:uncharacterized membrane protein